MNLVAKNDALEEKYKLLSELKASMMSVRDKLKEEEARQPDALHQKDTVIAGLSTTAQQQEDKIQMLVQKLAEMDQKIAHF